MGKPKLPLRRVLADDCIVYVGREIKDGQIVGQGAPYAVHEGEWVEVLPVTNLREFISITKLANFGTKASEGNIEALAKLESSLDDICERLAKRVVSWNWTGMMGEKLPQPFGNTEVLKGLTEDELLWLIQTSANESPGERKNA